MAGDEFRPAQHAVIVVREAGVLREIEAEVFGAEFVPHRGPCLVTDEGTIPCASVVAVIPR
jgi:hypothetical protein